MKRAYNQLSLIDTVRSSYQKYSQSFEILESIFLAFKTIVVRTKQSPRPRDYVHIDFTSRGLGNVEGFGLYWNEESHNNDTINIIIWHWNQHHSYNTVDEHIPLNSVSYFAPLFECARYLQINQPNILKSMSLENILYHIIKNSDDEVDIGFSSFASDPKSKYVPLSL